MKIINLVLMAVTVSLLSACVEYTNKQNDNAFKEALLRSRNVYAVSKNIDQNNPLEIKFLTQFEDQLVELNFEASPMNSAFYSVVNGENGLVQKKKMLKTPPQVSLEQMRVLLNGNDITSCLIAECNAMNCTGQGGILSNFSGDMQTSRIYLNLTKLDSTCVGIDLGTVENLHTLKVQEVGTGLKGAKIDAQVIVYNRTYQISKITKAFE